MPKVFVGHVAVKKCEKYSRELAEKYISFKRERYTVDNKLKNINAGVDMYLSGALAEYAAMLYCGIDPNKTMKFKYVPGGDRGVDFILKDGRTVDVKASNHAQATRLIWPRSKDINSIRASVLIAAKCDLSTRHPLGQDVYLMGWISSSDFIKKAQISDGHGGLKEKTFFIYYKDLNPMVELKGENYADY